MSISEGCNCRLCRSVSHLAFPVEPRPDSLEILHCFLASTLWKEEGVKGFLLSADSCSKYREWLDLLFDYGADFDAVDQNGNPPFMCLLGAYKYGPRILKYLIERGVKIDTVGRFGNNALFHEGIDISVLQLLLERGISTSVVNNFGAAALATFTPRPEKFQLCLEYGAEWLDHYRVFYYIDFESLACLAALGHEFYIQGGKKMISDELKARCYRSTPRLWNFVTSKRTEIARGRWRVIRRQALKMCIGLQSASIPALQMVYIIQEGFVYSGLIAFHLLWNLVVAVKHFHNRRAPRAAGPV